MDDTPDYVKKIQQEIWLAKPIGERLRLTLKMNDDLFIFWREMKKSMAEKYPPNQTDNSESL